MADKRDILEKRKKSFRTYNEEKYKKFLDQISDDILGEVKGIMASNITDQINKIVENLSYQDSERISDFNIKVAASVKKLAGDIRRIADKSDKELLSEKHTIEKKLNTLESSANKANTNEINALEDKLLLYKQILETRKDLSGLDKSAADTEEKRKQFLQQITDLYSQMEEMERKEILNKNMETIGKNTASRMFQIRDAQNSILNNFKESIQTNGIGGTINKFSEGFLFAIRPLKIVNALLTKIISNTKMFVKEYSSVMATLNKQTSSQDKFIDMTWMGTLDTTKFATTPQQYAQAISSFYREVAMFSLQTKETMKSIIDYNVSLERLGVSMSDNVGIFKFFNATLGKTPDMVQSVKDEMLAFAVDTKMAIGDVFSQFNNMLPRLAAHGEAAVKVFKQLSIFAKASQMNVEGLFGMTSKFDSLETSLKTAGNLNAMFGTNTFNGMELLSTASEAERLMIIKKKLDMQGVDLESSGISSKFQRQALAETLGISVDEMMKLMRTSQLQLQNLESQAKLRKLSDKEKEEIANTNKSIGDHLQAINRHFSFMVPAILKGVNALLSGVSGMFQWFHDITGGSAGGSLALTAGTVAGAALGFKLLFKVLAKIIKLPFTKLLGFFTKAAPAIGGTTAVMTPAAGALKAFGIQLGLVAGASLAFAHSIKIMSEAFMNFDKIKNPGIVFGSLVGALFALGAGIKAVTGAMAALSTVSLPMALAIGGGALLAVGGGAMIGAALSSNSREQKQLSARSASSADNISYSEIRKAVSEGIKEGMKNVNIHSIIKLDSEVIYDKINQNINKRYAMGSV